MKKVVSYAFIIMLSLSLSLCAPPLYIGYINQLWNSTSYETLCSKVTKLIRSKLFHNWLCTLCIRMLHCYMQYNDVIMCDKNWPHTYLQYMFKLNNRYWWTCHVYIKMLHCYSTMMWLYVWHDTYLQCMFRLNNRYWWTCHDTRLTSSGSWSY